LKQERLARHRPVTLRSRFGRDPAIYRHCAWDAQRWPCDAAQIETELAELRATFDIRWEADMRAIKRWQAAHPDSELVWPDHADLVVWLMGELEDERQRTSIALAGTDEP
jgi:hypothetical protein